MLAISSPKVTDTGISQLATLPNLKQLNIGGTKVTETGLQQLNAQRTGILAVFDDKSPSPRVYSH